MPRMLVIGDIHGCYRAFDRLLAFIQLEPSDTLVTLGDYVDRGPQSRQVLDRLISLKQTHNLLALRGNHEQMMASAIDDPQMARHWMVCGGGATLDSYNAMCGKLALLSDIPKHHWQFLNSLLPYLETDQYIFVHAGVDPDLPMENQREQTLYWQGYNDAFPGHRSGKLVICGHELQLSGCPATNGKSICIDTGAWYNGWLTCLDPDRNSVWQANELGETRRLNLEP